MSCTTFGCCVCRRWRRGRWIFCRYPVPSVRYGVTGPPTKDGVDATYRSEPRDLNELNFARFDAKLEQRIAEVRADMAVLHGKVESQVDALNHKVDAQAESLRGYMGSRIDSLRAELIKWMFLFWLGTVATMLGFVSLIP